MSMVELAAYYPDDDFSFALYDVVKVALVSFQNEKLMHHVYLAIFCNSVID